MRVYSLTNCWPVVPDPVDAPPAVEGDPAEQEWLEALEGVYTYDGLIKALGQPLSAHQHAMLKKDGEITLDGGLREVRSFNVDPGDQVKQWVAKSFKSGVSVERERLWSLACYFKDELLAARTADTSAPPAGQAQILAEFAEMVLDVTVAPVRYYSKGKKRGRVIEGSGPVEIKDDSAPPADLAVTVPSDRPVCDLCGFPLERATAVGYWECVTAAPKCHRYGIPYRYVVDEPIDVCIECGSPLDTGGHCHFIDCGKAVHPKVARDLPCGKTCGKLVCKLAANHGGMHEATDSLTSWTDGYSDPTAPDPNAPVCATCKRQMLSNGSNNGFYKCVYPGCAMRNISMRYSAKPKVDCCVAQPDHTKPISLTALEQSVRVANPTSLSQQVDAALSEMAKVDPTKAVVAAFNEAMVELRKDDHT